MYKKRNHSHRIYVSLYNAGGGQRRYVQHEQCCLPQLQMTLNDDNSNMSWSFCQLSNRTLKSTGLGEWQVSQSEQAADGEGFAFWFCYSTSLGISEESLISKPLHMNCTTIILALSSPFVRNSETSSLHLHVPASTELNLIQNT